MTTFIQDQATIETPCRYEPDLWFADSSQKDDIEYAKQLCKACHLTEACLSYALEHREKAGIWGAKTAEERASIIRAQIRRPRLRTHCDRGHELTGTGVRRRCLTCKKIRDRASSSRRAA